MLQRGAVVVSRGRTGVVWAVTPRGLVLLQIAGGPPLTRADVPITALADQLVTLASRAAHIRCGLPLAASAHGQRHIGDISPELLALVTAALTRAASDAGHAAKWQCERTHRMRAAAYVTERNQWADATLARDTATALAGAVPPRAPAQIPPRRSTPTRRPASP